MLDCVAMGADVAAVCAGMVEASVVYTQMIAIDLKKIDRFKKVGPETFTMH
jgi:hypothetical protein